MLPKESGIYAIRNKVNDKYYIGKTRYAGSANGQNLVWMYKKDYDKFYVVEVENKIKLAQESRRGGNSKNSKPIICLNGEKLKWAFYNCDNVNHNNICEVAITV